MVLEILKDIVIISSASDITSSWTKLKRLALRELKLCLHLSNPTLFLSLIKVLVREKDVIGIIKAYRKSEYDKTDLKIKTVRQMLFTQYTPFVKTKPAYCEVVYRPQFLGMYYFSSSGSHLLQSSPGALQCDVMDLPTWVISQVIASAVNPSETSPLLFSLVLHLLPNVLHYKLCKFCSCLPRIKEIPKGHENSVTVYNSYPKCTYSFVDEHSSVQHFLCIMFIIKVEMHLGSVPH